MPECKNLEEDQIEIFIGDQSDKEFLRDVKEKIGDIDIILDDGGHTMEQQIGTYEHLYSSVNKTGVYMVEDIHTSYVSKFGGGYKNDKSFIEYAKNFIDHIHAFHSNQAELTPSILTKNATGLHFYTGALVIENHPNPTRPPVSKTGKKSFTLVDA